MIRTTIVLRGYFFYLLDQEVLKGWLRQCSCSRLGLLVCHTVPSMKLFRGLRESLMRHKPKTTGPAAAVCVCTMYILKPLLWHTRTHTAPHVAVITTRTLFAGIFVHLVHFFGLTLTLDTNRPPLGRCSRSHPHVEEFCEHAHEEVR